MQYQIERLTENGWEIVRMNIESAEVAQSECVTMKESNPKSKYHVVRIEKLVVFETN